MPNAQPLTKTNAILDTLSPSMNAGEMLLSEFTLRMLKRDIGRLPDAAQSLTLSGVIAFLEDNVDLGHKLCEEALEMEPTSAFSWLNYAHVVFHKGFLLMHREILERAFLNAMTHPRIIKVAAINSAVWLDVGLLSRSIAQAQKEGLDLSVPPLSIANVKFEQIKALPSEVQNDLEFISKLCLRIADARKCPGLGSFIESSILGTHAFCYYTDVKNPQVLSDMNIELYSLMADADLHESDCSGFFLAKPGTSETAVDGGDLINVDQ